MCDFVLEGIVGFLEFVLLVVYGKVFINDVVVLSDGLEFVNIGNSIMVFLVYGYFDVVIVVNFINIFDVDIDNIGGEYVIEFVDEDIIFIYYMGVYDGVLDFVVVNSVCFVVYINLIVEGVWFIIIVNICVE